MSGGVLFDGPLRIPQKQAKDYQPKEQLILPGLEAPAPAGPVPVRLEIVEGQKIRIAFNKRRLKFRWHDPVTTRRNDWILWVCSAMPERYHCGNKECQHRGDGSYKFIHYHCYDCAGPIFYGDLHGGSQIHLCLDCCIHRSWGRQPYPEYNY